MKKIFMLLSALVMFCGSAVADDGLLVPDVNVPQGGTATLEIALENPTLPFTAFQFEVQLADGIAVPTNDKGKLVYEPGERLEGEDFTLSVSNPETNSYQVLGYYVETQPIPGNSGAVVKLTIAADAALEVGSSHVCKVAAINLTETNETKHSPEDISFTITIGEPDDGFIKFDETSTKLPTYTAGEKGNVRVKRTIKAGQWSTLVLPFNLTKTNATAIFGEGYEMATFAGFQVDYGEDEENVTPLGIELNFSNYTIPARGNLAGGTPVLIKTAQDITEFELEDVTLVDAVTDVEKADEYGTPGKFTATLVKSVIPADGLFISDNKFYYSAGETNVKAFRGWFELGAVLDRETDFGAKVRFTIEEESTDIKDVQDGEAAAVKKGYYTLNGRKLNGKPTEKGIYIVDGKKVANY